MLYLTCTMMSSVDLAHYGVSRAKDWISVDCGTIIIIMIGLLIIILIKAMIMIIIIIVEFKTSGEICALHLTKYKRYHFEKNYGHH